jgi:hypothetical protein
LEIACEIAQKEITALEITISPQNYPQALATALNALLTGLKNREGS